MAKATKAERAEELESLQKLLHPGDTVYTKVEHVSRSGMLRVITPLILRVDVGRAKTVALDTGNPTVTIGERELSRYYLGYAASKVLDLPIDGNQGVKVSGAGMDMGFHLVYSLSRAVFRDGFDCVSNGESYCPSNDHSNTRPTACAICDTALCVCGRRPIEVPTGDNGEFERLCPECNKSTDKRYTLSSKPFDYGCDCEPIAGHYRTANGRQVAVCSEECAHAVWHHQDGGYALQQKWL